jgi:hypothetical protein
MSGNRAVSDLIRARTRGGHAVRAGDALAHGGATAGRTASTLVGISAVQATGTAPQGARDSRAPRADSSSLDRAKYSGRGGRFGWKRKGALEHTWDRHSANSKGSAEPIRDPLPKGARPPGSEHPPTAKDLSKFPPDWDLDRIARSAAEVANDPKSTKVQLSNGLIDIYGSTGGLKMRVRVSPRDQRIVTAHPLPITAR